MNTGVGNDLASTTPHAFPRSGMSEGAWDQDADTLSLPRTQESLAEFSWGDCASFGTRLEEAAVLRGLVRFLRNACNLVRRGRLSVIS